MDFTGVCSMGKPLVVQRWTAPVLGANLGH
jgi:hypothetical protein